AAAVGNGPVVDDRDQLRCDFLIEAARERRDSLAIEVALETVTDRLVEEGSRPAGAEDERHRAGRRLDRGELQRRLTRRLAGEALPALVLEEPVEGNAAAATVTADLPLGPVFRDDGDVQACQRPDVADGPAGRGHDQHDDV